MADALVLRGGYLPVTALKYTEVWNEEYLLAGEGPCLKLFSGRRLLCSIEVLPFGVVHGIRLWKKEGVELRVESEVVEQSDWLLDVKSLHWAGCRDYTVAAITAHNVCTLYQVIGGIPHNKTARNQVSCILYSASLCGDALDSLAIVSGTVFNQILLWTVGKDMSSKLEPIRVSFRGHEGVIFSVEFSEVNLRLVSASDDRTVRVWSVPTKWRELTNWEESSCLLVLYGHTSRVWSAEFLPSGCCNSGGDVISIGEDATCRTWGLDGSMKRVLRGHKGKCIWSLAVSKSGKTVATGGGDCSIRTYALDSSSSVDVAVSSQLLCERDGGDAGVPRYVFLVGQTPICLTDKGTVLAGTLHSTEITFTTVYRDVHFSSYSIAAISTTDPPVLALGNLHGSIVLLKLDYEGSVVQHSQVEAHSGKVFSLSWDVNRDHSQHRYLVSCGPQGEMVCWKLHIDPLAMEKLSRLSLPPSKHRWLGAVTILDSPPESDELMVLCGDRRGSLHLYRCRVGEESCPCVPVQTLHGVHGPNGVTHCCVYGGYVYSCGRNGECRKFEMCNDGRCLLELIRFKPVKGVDWLERMIFLDDGDLLLVGFHGTELIVHSSSQNRAIVSVACGGGHRSYAVNFVPNIADIGRVNVLYIKQAQVYYSEVPAQHGSSSNSLLQEPFVGLEALSMVLLHHTNSAKSVLAAVGSEDNSVCVYRLFESAEDSSLSIKHVLTIQGHTSAVKALSSSPCSGSSKQLLFSGGGKASLKVWMLTENDNKVEVRLDRDIYLHDPVKRKAKFEPRGAEVAPECRVMSLASFPMAEVLPGCDSDHSHYVAAGCSDAIIRQFIYNTKGLQPVELPSINTNKKCVLSVKYFITRDEDEPPSETCEITPAFLYYSTTDGYISFYNLTTLLHHYHTHVSNATNRELDWPRREIPSWFKVHQSGINAMDVRSARRPPSCKLVLSGGDDNGLAVTALQVVEVAGGSGSLGATISHTVSVLWQLITSAAHSSAITGVGFLNDELVVSTSVDQRLNVWRMNVDRSNLALVSSCTHDVADASSLCTYSDSHDEKGVVVCGIGMQCFKFNANIVSTDHKQK